MMTDQDTIQMRSFLEALRDLAAGRKQFQDLTISTSEGLALRLACDSSLPEWCKGEKDAWEKLNKVQRRTVATINPKFQEKHWAEIPVYFG